MKEKMIYLINRLIPGKYRYAGVKRTFHVNFTYHTVITVSSPESTLKECEHLLEAHPNWRGNAKIDRIFLVHTPKADYSLDDDKSPYYRIKRFLLEHGIPCQMVNAIKLSPKTFFCRVGNVFLLPTVSGPGAGFKPAPGSKNTLPTLQYFLT